MPRPSTGEYPPDWPVIALKIKAKAKWKCERCTHPHDTRTGHVLTVHHLDLNKSNVEWWNLVALCQRCHLRIQAKVNLERPWIFGHSSWFVPYVAGFYAHKLKLPTKRDWVEECAEEIIRYYQTGSPPVGWQAILESPWLRNDPT